MYISNIKSFAIVINALFELACQEEIQNSKKRNK